MDRLIAMPEKVCLIIETLVKEGYEAYAVGGCIRDSILGRCPDDWDITTSALPEEVKRLFGRTIDTGIRHGTVTVMLGREGFEVTTYRIDGEYEDSRHPKEVTFTASLEEDLKRRDFTINALAYNHSCGLVDLFDGLKDMEQKIIRCVGNPMERFREDALRMMRAVRFSAQLGYSIAPETREAVRCLAGNLRKISPERIRTELMKLLLSPNPAFLGEVCTLGMTAVFLPEFDRMMQTEQNNPHHCHSVGQHTLHTLEASVREPYVRLSLLMHDTGKPETRTTDEEGIDHFHGHASFSRDIAERILLRLRFDNKTSDAVLRLTLYHDLWPDPEPRQVRKAIQKVGTDIFPLWLEVKQADILAQSTFNRENKIKRLNALRQIYEEILKSGDCLTLKELAVTGRDLMEIGIMPGQRLGQILRQLLEIVTEQPDANRKDRLLEEARKLMRNSE